MAGIACCAVLMLLVGCTQGGSTGRVTAPPASISPVARSEQAVSTVVPFGTPARPAGYRTATATGPGSQALLGSTLAGQRTFLTVSGYLDWLANKPGNASVSVSATQSTDGAVQANVVVTASDGQQSTGSCAVSATSVAAHQLTWYDCPQLLALWTGGGPTTFPSLDAARHYFPAYVFMPPSLPGGYQLTSIQLPSTPAEAARNPFVMTVDYTAASTAPLRLMEQPAGAGEPIIPGYDTCVLGQPEATPGSGVPITYGTERAATPAVVRCAAWADKATWFLMTGDADSGPALRQVVPAIEGLQHSS